MPSAQRLLPFVLSGALCLGAAAVPSYEGTQRDEALRELRMRADSGDGEALYRVAYLTERGYDSIAPDSVVAIELYLRSAETGYVPAQSYAGFLLYRSTDPADRERGLALMRAAADNGDAKAANNLGYLLAYPADSAVAPSYREAQYWLGRAAAEGLPTAQAQLADLLKAGLGSAPDTARAEALYRVAIEGGVADAQLKLLVLKMPEWKSLPSDTLMTLGRRFYTHRAPTVGVELFDVVAERDSLAEAFALLGDAYSRAQGVSYDHERSLHYFLTAALRGNAAAQFVIAELLDIFPDSLEGRPELPADAPEALHTADYWYDLAAHAGITDASAASRSLLTDKQNNSVLLQ
ncbi:MAG: sel1 repeat family protein [Muribaculaceae bacterium]|nr:sel1 repeat family protein [Muribaculaceae bacterium]